MKNVETKSAFMLKKIYRDKVETQTTQLHKQNTHAASASASASCFLRLSRDYLTSNGNFII